MTKHLAHQPRKALLTQRPPAGPRRPWQPPFKGPQAALSQGRTTNGHLTGGGKHCSEWTTSRLHPAELLPCPLHRCAATRSLSRSTWPTRLPSLLACNSWHGCKGVSGSAFRIAVGCRSFCGSCCNAWVHAGRHTAHRPPAPASRQHSALPQRASLQAQHQPHSGSQQPLLTHPAPPPGSPTVAIQLRLRQSRAYR